MYDELNEVLREYRLQVYKSKKKESENDEPPKTEAIELTRTRISKDDYYLKIAQAVALRSTCLRRKYGAVIVKNDQIVATGYNGAPRGATNCCDTGECKREALNVPHGERYELCRSVHAEQNAIISAGFEKTNTATLYLSGIDGKTGQPIAYPDCCMMCKRIVINAGIDKVIFSNGDGTMRETDPKTWLEGDDL